MYHWKIENLIITLLGGISGGIAFINGIPYGGFILLDTNWISQFLGLAWGCTVAALVGACSWAGKKLIEENWPTLKAFVKSSPSRFCQLFKRKKNNQS